ncbi:MAG: A/G-specific adenine glycosylase [Polyangiaceae bacterium]|nr:A/G-specific adenine glycosylase [Polyangiaceae bacterium]
MPRLARRHLTEAASSPTSVSPARRRAIATRLLRWYEQNRRHLPWRHRRDPYAIWVSEVMLQQTQVATVTPYYERWMQRFPTVRALACADEDAVLGVWQGLGYYSRARRLLAGARTLVSVYGGEVPSTVAELRRVPGIGAYSAGAIASIAFGVQEPAVDGNAARVLGRLECVEGDPKRAQVARRLSTIARRLVPLDRPGDFNQALMELGATLCVPRRPECSQCPLQRLCRARRQRRTEQLVAAPAQPPKRQVHMVAAVIRRAGRVLVARQRDDAARWAGLWKFPDAELGSAEQPEVAVARAAQTAARVTVAVDRRSSRLRFVITNHSITLDVYECRVRGRTGISAGQHAAWKLPLELEALAMPAAHRKIARSLPGSSDRGRAVRSDDPNRRQMRKGWQAGRTGYSTQRRQQRPHTGEGKGTCA